MISLLHLLHDVATPRGDGLHPELCRRLSMMDASKIDELNTTAGELQRRRDLAHARKRRESERKTLLGMLLDAHRQAMHLRLWIDHHGPRFKAEDHGEVIRMLQWAGEELAALEAMAEPKWLTATLRQQNLFPDIGELADPLGDPPPLRPWGR
jgi:hypothetical protein